MIRRSRSSPGSTPLLGLAMALGLILGAWILGSQVKAMRLADRYVNVKGLAERTVKPDLAIWPLNIKETGDDLAVLSTKTEADKNVVLQFLTQQGIQTSETEVGGDRGQGVTYKFNGLNAVKPDMITEATRNARSAADRFAADSGSKVGSIRFANQGVFAILAANQGSATGESPEYAADSSPDASMMKTVRVVTTLEYYLDK